MIPKSKIFNLKSFINEFNFPSPDWESLPVGFPYLERDGLTRRENHLLGAIILAWQATQPQGKRFLSRKVSQSGIFLVICLISLIGLIRLIALSPGENFAKPVQAATQTVSGVIQSTMSAILKK